MSLRARQNGGGKIRQGGGRGNGNGSPGGRGNSGNGPAVYNTTWDPANKGAGVVLSNGNRTAVTTDYLEWAFSTTSRSSGKWYFELLIDAVGFGMAMGVQKTTQPNTGNYLGFPSLDGPAIMRLRGVGFLNTMSPSTSGTNLFATNVLGCAVDIDTGQVQFFKNNVADGGGTCTFFSGPYQIAVLNNYGNGLSTQYTLRTKTSQLSYSPPTGYTAWDNQ